MVISCTGRALTTIWQRKTANTLPTAQASPKGCIFYYLVVIFTWKSHGHFRINDNANLITSFPSPSPKHDLPSMSSLAENFCSHRVIRGGSHSTRFQAPCMHHQVLFQVALKSCPPSPEFLPSPSSQRSLPLSALPPDSPLYLITTVTFSKCD